MIGYALFIVAILLALAIFHQAKPPQKKSKTEMVRFCSGKLISVELEHGQQPMRPTAKGVNFGRA